MDKITPRDEFNALAVSLGLTVTNTTTDGWSKSFTRPDGLHLWRASGFWEGCFIQTAWVDPESGDYVDHQPFMRKANWGENLKAAVLRPGKDAPAEMPVFRHGSKDAEIDRTAEMVVGLAASGKVDQAVWLIHDSNRFGPAEMKFLAQRVEHHAKLARR